MSKIKALIVDDESLARELVKNYLSGCDDVELLGECENGFEAIKSIQELQPDLMFLDVQMPKINGFELLEVLDETPEIIFTTAFDQYAIQAFEKNAIDYLLKPFSKERFFVAIEKAKSKIQNKENSPENIKQLKVQIQEDEKIIERIIVKKGYKIIVIPVDDIHYLEAQDDYVLISCDKGRFLKDKTMKYYENHLPEDFVRIHRSHIVPVSQIESIEQFGKDSHLVVLKCGVKLRASAQGYKKLREQF